MPDLETTLAALVDRPLADPEPVAELERRAGRIRRRRLLTRIGAGTTALATLAVALVLVARPDDQAVKTIPPAELPPGPGPLGPPPPPPMATVARVEIDGQEWRAVASYDEASGAFCSGEQQGGLTNWGCGEVPLTQGDLLQVAPSALASMLRPGAEPPLAPNQGSEAHVIFGPVAKSVATVRLELTDGRNVEVPVSGWEVGLPVNFYAITVPLDGDPKAVVALDDDGRELARKEQPLWDSFTPCPPPRTEHERCGPLPPGGGLPAGTEVGPGLFLPEAPPEDGN